MTAYESNPHATAIAQPPYDDEIDLLELLAKILKKWRWWVSGTVLGGLIGLMLAFTLPPKYEAYGVVRLSKVGKVDTVSGGESLTATPVESVTEAAARMQSLAFREAVVDQLVANKLAQSSERAAWLAQMESGAFKAVKDTGFLSITLRASSPEAARGAVETVTQVLKQRQKPLMDERIAATQKVIAHTKSAVNSIQTRYASAAHSLQAAGTHNAGNYLELSRLSEAGTYATLQDKLVNLENSLQAPSTKAAELVEPATVADKPVSPKKPLLLALGMVLGLLAGLGLGFARPAISSLRAKMQ